MRLALAAAAAIVLCTGASRADPYVEAAARPDAQRSALLDVIFGRPGAEARLRDRLTQAPTVGTELGRRGWSLLCGGDFHAGRYGEALEDCSRAVSADPDGGDGNTLAIVRLLAAHPPTTASGGARVAVSSGEHIAVSAGDYAGYAIADTGAQISVMMQSVAARAHVTILGRSASVGSTTASVMGEVGIVPQVRLGGATLRDLPVLVLPDASLTLAGGQVRLPFILSLYAMAAFGRIAWLDHGRTLAFGEASPQVDAGGAPLVWDPFGVSVPADGVAGRRAAHFDSGANLSYLRQSGLALIAPEERAAIRASVRRVGGVGGVRDEAIQTLPRATLHIAGQTVVLADVDVASDTESGEAAQLGEDFIARYGAVVLDFHAMRFSIAP